jgi:uncharacterized protein YcaQ
VNTLASLRAAAVAQTLFAPTTLQRAIHQLGYVQADPIRAPARAQDLILFQRVKGYRAGDLEQRYAQLDVEEDHFINYGFLPRWAVALMHPRTPRRRHSRTTAARAEALIEFVRERDEVHPRDVDAHFQHGKVTNAWGGMSSATTHLLDDLHYRGHLRIARREKGIRIYAPPFTLSERSESKGAEAQLDALVDLAVALYAPVPKSTLTMLVSRLRYCAPQFAHLRGKALQRAQQRLAHARVDGVDWYWPEQTKQRELAPTVRLLAPFDPVVWDRRRVELLWSWTYRFEAYTPVKQRKLGYYALPMLFGDALVGWGNLSLDAGGLHANLGYIAGTPPRSATFRRGLDEELERFRAFLAPR